MLLSIKGGRGEGVCLRAMPKSGGKVNKSCLHHRKLSKALFHEKAFHEQKHSEREFDKQSVVVVVISNAQKSRNVLKLES